MLRARNAPALPTVSFDANARRHGRLRVAALTCTLGPVLDLSASGMRVECRGKPPIREGEAAELTMHAPFGPFTVKTRVHWIRRAGFRRYHIGLEFVDMTDEGRKALNLIARSVPTDVTIGRDAA